MSPKQIAFFNHKGGVSKTTSVFHIGWMLAEIGHKVLLVDCDPQCNLTGLILKYTDAEEYPYESKSETLNVRDGLSPAFDARPVPLKPVKVQTVRSCENLFVLPGHVGLAEYESQLSIAHSLSSSLSVMQNIPGSLRHLFDITGESIEADFVLVDMSPSLGAINQNILTTSDAFIIPMAPDFFSAMALRSLSKVLPKWISWSQQAAEQEILREAAYPWPNKLPKFVGSIVQNYRIRSRDGKEAAPTRAYQKWFDALVEVKRDVLIPSFSKAGLLMDEGIYSRAHAEPTSFLAEVPDFNSLIAISQSLSKPVFTLTREDIANSGSVAQNQVESAEGFKEVYRIAATKIIEVVKY